MQPRIYIDISSIEALKESIHDANLVLGAGMTLTDMMLTFRKWADSNEDFRYLNEFYKHVDLVAHVPVRNVGTIGGNLAIKNIHPDFPSDIFLLLETVQATVTIVNNSMEKKEVGMQNFLKEDLKNKLILDVKLPPLASNCLVRTFKIMPRSQNAHAIVNAGFMFKIDSANKVVEANIVFGAISPTFIRARQTEDVLKGQNLYSEGTLQTTLTKLKNELIPVDVPPEPSPACRKTLAVGLLYKAILSFCTSVNPRYKSGGTLLERGVSHGTQTFDTDKKLWPLNQPIPKLEALTQCSGEVKYVCDVTGTPRGAHVAFVLSTICVGEIDRFDASEALKLPGVLAFYTAKDIPGKNTFTPSAIPWQEFEEEIFASKQISYYGQPLGIVAAITHKLALKAADLVKVFYKKSEAKPVLNIKDALAAPDKDRRVRNEKSITPTSKGQDIQHVIKGTFAMGSQYHYTMETQCCSVSNTDQGVSVRASTQWMDLVHVAVAQMLALPENKVEVVVPRVGGAYGGKASRSGLVACACALAAYKLNRDATLVMPLTDNMASIGKRQSCYAEYEVGVDNEGLIQYLNLSYYSDCGFSFNDTSAAEVAGTLTNLYASERWSISGYSVLTDTASNTWCRAPGTTEATAIVEHLMERIAFTTNKDPVDVRIANLDAKHTTIKDIITSFERDCHFDERRSEISRYNNGNAWKKRALTLSLMSYPIGYSGNFPVTISVYHADGTVAISHGGIEMGQGINTKVAQVCAYTLKIPLDKVLVKGSDNFVSPNAMASNGSITSESVAYATVRACKALLMRLEPARKELNEPTWEEVVKQAYEKGINLQSSYMMSTNDPIEGYSVYGCCATEVELDVLSGAHVVRRVDLLEDTAVSLSPQVDVGQIEGSYMMGLGLWTSEQLVFDRNTGRLLTDRTWTYKPCGARDVPLDFRVSFRRNSINRAGVLRSKATGEPALVLAVGVTHALHNAIMDARKEFGYNDIEWIHVETPYNIENILKAISPNTESYKIK
ncbi:uncharacterized protein LOC126373077 isoform X1 [Pectinophora gossypiella]|nr:uncharacterized protein LOC126373077 isoform X1 [Pectinophora gossypiella]